MKKMLFVYNPKSGKGLIKKHLFDIVDIMVKADYDVTIYPTQAGGDATRKVAECAGDYDLVVCSGGDGTLDETVTGLLQNGADIPLGYIPAGSTNDFANSLEIPKGMVNAAKVAVSGEPFACDSGYFNGDTFVYVAAFGVFTEVSYKTSQQMKNVLGHLAYILEGTKQLHRMKKYKMKISWEDQVIEDEFIYGMVTNSVSVGGFSGITGKDVKLDDGVFEVTLIKKPKNPIELTEILSCLTSKKDTSDLIYSFKTNEIHFESEEAVAWTTDGEFGGDYTDLTVKNLHQRIKIIVEPKS